MSLPHRHEIDTEHRFDLTRIFDSPAAWHEAAEEFRDRLAALEARASKPLTGPAALDDLLTATVDCHERRASLALYAELYPNVHTEDDAAADVGRADRELTSALEPVVAAVRRRLAAVDRAQFDAWLDALDRDGRYAENLRDAGTHTREPAVEETIAAFEEPRTAPTRTVRAVTDGDFQPGTVERPDGESVELRYGNVVEQLSHEDRDYRRRVYETYRTEMDRFEHVLTRAVAEKLAAAAATTEVRGYDSIREWALSDDSYPATGVVCTCPEAVHETLLHAVPDNREPFDRARRLRRDRLGLDTLRPWDTRVPVVGSGDNTPKTANPEVSYPEARELIVDALAPLGESYVARVERYFDERRIDVFPTQNKRTDIPAYCPSAPADGAFVLANFREDVRTTFYVAHELGHAINVDYHTEGPTRYANSRTAVCEVPSILHEILLAEHLTRRGGRLAAAARNRLVECLGGNIYRNARATAFGHRLAVMVEDGEEITPERARATYRDLGDRYDPVVEPPADREGRDWLGRGTRPAYTGYQYVLGAVGALRVRAKLRDDDLDTSAYHEFLRNTGRDDAVTAFQRVGVDPTSRQPYRLAAAQFDDYVADLERATARTA